MSRRGITNVVRLRAQWNRIFEPAMAPTEDEHAWAADLARGALDVLPLAQRIGVHVLEPEDQDSLGRTLTILPRSREAAKSPSASILESLVPATMEALREPPASVTTLAELGEAPPSHSPSGSDALLVIAHPAHRSTIILWAVHDREIVLSRHQRQLLMQIAFYLECGHRLRTHPEAVRAILGREGKLGSVSQGRRRNAEHEARDLWSALVGGRFCLAPRGAGGKREYFVLENPEPSLERRALTSQELDAVALSARGVSTKAVADRLGITSGSVSARLASAAAKLGLTSRLELIRLAAVLARPERVRPVNTRLSDAERDVLLLLQQGLSNRDIARTRERSARTVANQVAALLRKMQVGSRRELVARET